jgi:hypothetical protein
MVGVRLRGRKRFSTEHIILKLREAEVLIECWRREYNTVRLQSVLGYRPPAPEAIALFGAEMDRCPRGLCPRPSPRLQNPFGKHRGR